MSQRDAPAFDFYPERWLVGTAAMSDAEQLSYLRLLCHQWTMDGLPIDTHVCPVAAGGPDDVNNLQPLYRRCNSAKGGRI
jgi:hypothetical protein